jgi:signal transduction histidine kinase
MKSLRRLIVLNAALLLALGFGMALFWPRSLPVVFKQYEEAATIRFLGTIVGSLGIVLFMLRNQILSDERRRLALGLCTANTLIALMSLMQETGPGWVKPLGGLLVLLPFGMAAAMAWVGLRPARLDEEAETLPIPDEVRRSWLRQIGEAAVQEERNRLARDLHDSIKQQLFTINVSTAAAQELWEQNPEKAKAALVDVRRSAHEAMVEMQAMLHQLQPYALASSGLVEALREQCEALGYRTSAEVLLDLGEAIPDDRLPPGAQETLFRIAQEALSNVARHARARRVRVYLGREGDRAVLRIADNGQGFTPEEERAGTGLRSLRERAESLRGNLEIDSAAGAGTAIAVSIPLTLPPVTAARALYGSWPGYLLLSLATVICLLHLIRSTESWIATIIGVLYVVLLARLGFSSLRRPAAAPAGAASPNLSRFQNHRSAALSFVLAAGIAPWSWRRGEIWVGWTAFWLFAALLAMGLAVFALVRLHHASEWQPRWWHSSKFRLGPVEWGLLGGSAVLLWVTVGMWWLFSFLGPHPPPSPSPLFEPLHPLEAAFVLTAATVLLYVRTRQPRTERAPE